jgi:hypothetical protein
MIRSAPRRHHLVLAASLSLLPLSFAVPASADDTIKHPGDHPSYSVEIEPHVLLGWDNVYAGSAFGIGGRFTIPIVQNGFVPTINNSVGIGFGLDVMFYENCYYRGPCSATYLDFPVVMQWNFFVAKRWSVFGEPGLFIYHGFLPDCPNGVACPQVTGIEPALFLGGRYHLSDSTSLTMRIGFPSFSFGFSFFL